MFYSQFLIHFAANRHKIPAAERAAIVREAQARSMQARASCPVTWDDLIERIERALGA